MSTDSFSSGQSAVIDQFKAAFAKLGPQSEMKLDELYIENVVFEDPFHRVEGREALEGYFRRLNSRIESAEFAFGEEIVAQGAAAITWIMTLRLKRPRKTIVVPGISHLKFTDRIVAQRDYFDVGASMYEQLPLLGGLLRWIKRKAS